MSAPVSDGTADIRFKEGRLTCIGSWTLKGIEDLSPRLATVVWPKADIVLDGSSIQALDTTGAMLLMQTMAKLRQDGHQVRLLGLKPPHQALLDLVVERSASAGQMPEPEPDPGLLVEVGQTSWEHLDQALKFLAFVGEAATVLGRAVLKPRRIRWRVLLANIEGAGVNALPIVALLSFLVGVVIAYQGGEQLKLYGANIFIVELVSLTMLREIAPLVTAIIVAGRTGSAYTAQIGTMQVTEEVDALRTIGIVPMELLVLPKLMALLVALPLLTLFADAMSVFGGMVVAFFILDVSFFEFIDRIPRVVTLFSFLLGVGKAPLFAAVIALVGCYRGLQVRGGADSVGRQTTISVVQAIFLVIVVDAVLVVFLGAAGL